MLVDNIRKEVDQGKLDSRRGFKITPIIYDKKKHQYYCKSFNEKLS